MITELCFRYIISASLNWVEFMSIQHVGLSHGSIIHSFKLKSLHSQRLCLTIVSFEALTPVTLGCYRFISYRYRLATAI